MQRYLATRVSQTLIALLGVLMLVFVMARLSGDPARLYMGDYSNERVYQQVRANLGLDRPIPVQFAVYLKGIAHGDLGTSWTQFRPASVVALDAFPATLQLAAAAFTFALIVGLPLGVLSAVKRDTLFDQVGRIIAVLGQSVPTFWMGIMLILFFSVSIRVFPAGGRSQPSSIILPAFTLSAFPIAAITQLTRSAMLDVLDTEYVKMARLKGLPEWQVIWKHAFRNAAIPVVTLLGLLAGDLLRGAVVTEQVFSWQGVGLLAVNAIRLHDFPVVQAVVLLSASTYMLISLIVDITYAFLDPRIRIGQ